jgi:hypothetical protein
LGEPLSFIKTWPRPSHRRLPRGTEDCEDEPLLLLPLLLLLLPLLKPLLLVLLLAPLLLLAPVLLLNPLRPLLPLLLLLLVLLLLPPLLVLSVLLPDDELKDEAGLRRPPPLDDFLPAPLFSRFRLSSFLSPFRSGFPSLRFLSPDFPRRSSFPLFFPWRSALPLSLPCLPIPTTSACDSSVCSAVAAAAVLAACANAAQHASQYHP